MFPFKWQQFFAEHNFSDFHIFHKIDLHLIKIRHDFKLDSVVAGDGFGFRIDFYIEVVVRYVITGSEWGQHASQGIRFCKCLS